MLEFFAKAGDTRPIETECNDAEGPVNLTGATVKFRYRNVSGGDPVVQDAEVTDALTGAVRYVFQEGELIAGSYESEWFVTLAGGEMATFPTDQYIYLRVFEAIVSQP